MIAVGVAVNGSTFAVMSEGGGAYIGGDVVAGDFVGGDKISVSVGSNSRNVAIGGNINQSTIITGDSVIIRRNR